MNEYKTKTISGPIASFSDGLAGSTCKEIICDIHSKQDLNGYDKPWAGGCNVNQWKPISGTDKGVIFTVEYDGTVTISGTLTEDGKPMVYEDYSIEEFGISIGDPISVYSEGDCYGIFRFRDSNGDLISQLKSGATGTVPEGTVSVRVFQMGAPDGSSPVTGDTISTVGKFEVDISSSAITEWTPWANVCPIIGRDHVFIENSGKNIIEWGIIERTSTSAGMTSVFMDDGGFNCSGTATSTNFSITNRYPIAIKKEPTFILSRTTVEPNNNTKLYFISYDDKLNNAGNVAVTSAGGLSKKWLPRDQELHVLLSLSSLVKNTSYNFNIYPMLEIATGDTATQWEPYKGDRSLSQFKPIGKNLLSMDVMYGIPYGPTVGEHYDLRENGNYTSPVKNPDGSFTFTTTTTRNYFTFIAPIEPGKTYRRYFKLMKLKGAFRFSYVTLDKDFNVLSVSNSTPSASIGVEYEYSQYTTYSTTKPYAYAAFVFTNYTTGNSQFKIIEPQIELGQTKTAYEPYMSVYEGSYSSNGTVTRTHESITFDGSEDEMWVQSVWNDIYRYYIVISDAKSTHGSRSSVLSNRGLSSGSANTPGTIFISGYNGDARLYFIPPQTITTVADFKTWLASNPLQVKYELAEPVTSPATRNLITLVDSEVNNIYCDAGDVTVEYFEETGQPVVQEYFVKESTLTSIADAIRTVKGTSDPIEVDNFVNEIDNMNLPLLPAEEVEF